MKNPWLWKKVFRLILKLVNSSKIVLMKQGGAEVWKVKVYSKSKIVLMLTLKFNLGHK